MDIATYRPLIAKVLAKSSGKGLTPDQVASAICDRIISFEEDMALMGGTTPLIIAPQPKPAERSVSIDISDRISAKEDVNPQMVERFTKERLLDFARNEMPSSIMVKPPEYDQPFEIAKHIEGAPGDLGFVSITYQVSGGAVIDGQRIGPTERISTTDPMLDADALTESIIKQANSLYTKQKKVLVSRMPPVGGGPGDLSGALMAEAPGTGEEGLKMPMDGTMSRQWSQQRR